MKNYKKHLLDNICYTELVYGRINKKLKINFSNAEIEELVLDLITKTDESNFERIGKNIYITNHSRGIRITINSYTDRLITADKLKKE